MSEKGLLIVVSGPSGVGKGTLCNALVKNIDNLFISISATTRPPRTGEVNGVNYIFMNQENFEEKIEEGQFLEWAKVYNNYYGTPKEFVIEKLKEGKDVILEIDIQGAAQVKKNCPNGVFVFIAPPSLEELRKRIINRGTDNEESINLRLKSAKEEMRASFDYDYVIINDDLDKAVLKLQSVILAERCKVSRNKDKILEIIGD
ncbi:MULTISPECIES: guanylate kinase [Tepidanaerobacter]|uniref:Guanylate kinase n=1 Tax=Tepidanaerobacter syntrophicus TaxID=224999 RepID=A0A0U9HGS6_9FIRM|nr:MULTISPECIES: guanylate kinase [Tepidanaerobacter]GAQ26064.1 guanylate kinase [Tepidanaerobacter syntrophicus]GLI19621.1 guanylate kinase [Tepidanaerobacter syntrophicus]